MNILDLNPQLLFGAAGVIGAGVRGLVAYYKVKKANPKIKFDTAMFIDTAIAGIGAGIAFSVGLPISYVSMAVTALAGVGVDSYTNKFGIKITPMLRDWAISLKGKKKK